MYNKKYNKIMSRISRVLKRRLNEDIFSDGRYDRWKTSSPYDDEEDINGVINVDIIDTLNGNVLDDDELEKLLNICNKSGIYDDTNIEVITNGSEIIADEQLQAALSRIKIQKYRDIISNYVYEQIEKEIESGDYIIPAQQELDYREGLRDEYRNNMRKKILGEKYKFRRR